MNEDLIRDESLRRRMAKRLAELNKKRLDGLYRAAGRMARKTGAWFLDRMGVDVDYSPYDAEGRPQPEE